MDVTGIAIAVLNKINPIKGIRMFCKWFLRRELEEKDNQIKELKEKELALQEYEINCKLPTFCPVCKTHSMIETNRDTRSVMYRCSECGYKKPYNQISRPEDSSINVKAQRQNRQTRATGTGEIDFF